LAKYIKNEKKPSPIRHDHVSIDSLAKSAEDLSIGSGRMELKQNLPITHCSENIDRRMLLKKGSFSQNGSQNDNKFELSFPVSPTILSRNNSIQSRTGANQSREADLLRNTSAGSYTSVNSSISQKVLSRNTTMKYPTRDNNVEQNGYMSSKVSFRNASNDSHTAVNLSKNNGGKVQLAVNMAPKALFRNTSTDSHTVVSVSKKGDGHFEQNRYMSSKALFRNAPTDSHTAVSVSKKGDDHFEQNRYMSSKVLFRNASTDSNTVVNLSKNGDDNVEQNGDTSSKALFRNTTTDYYSGVKKGDGNVRQAANMSPKASLNNSSIQSHAEFRKPTKFLRTTRVCLMIARWQYIPTSPDGIGFLPGDVLEFVKRLSGTSAVLKLKSGKMGLGPLSFLREINGLDHQVKFAVLNCQHDTRLNVKWEYGCQSPDEIDLRVGDIIQFKNYIDDQKVWCQVINMSTKMAGVVPLSHLDYTTRKNSNRNLEKTGNQKLITTQVNTFLDNLQINYPVRKYTT
jgi:hypothetical protein